ncbi:hypothetical protein [Geoglobus acetivorans]|uniref:Uncharacterized protein n=1 Tax=Geoglobus acetivorans TaxID=565033 RepID=A0ABZ3H5T0_GEOAI|nr:hypothetical protein [Geoglobus acetivorans]
MVRDMCYQKIEEILIELGLTPEKELIEEISSFLKFTHVPKDKIKYAVNEYIKWRTEMQVKWRP